MAHLSFPIDVQAKRLADDDETLGGDVQHGAASSWVPQIEVPPLVAVRAAADLLNAGSRTVLLVGQGALRATTEVEAVAERRAAPVVKAFLGKTVIADSSPYSTGGYRRVWNNGLLIGNAGLRRFAHRRLNDAMASLLSKWRADSLLSLRHSSLSRTGSASPLWATGGFTMLRGEVGTAAKYKLPIKVVVLKNNHYSRIISEDQALGIPPFGTELQPIDFVRFAEACCGAGFACARPEEVRPALEAAWRVTDRPALVEATIDNDADASLPDAYVSKSFQLAVGS